MAQIAIREYDAKRLFATFQSCVYRGYLIQWASDLDLFDVSESESDIRWVIKPDQLFGKRGKYGLIGVNLSSARTHDWYQEYNLKEVMIGEQLGKLNTFLIEPFIPHTEEYYVAIKTERDHDILYFSTVGGIEIEENWEQVHSVKISLKQDTQVDFALSLDITNPRIIDFLSSLYGFFVEYGFAYLEVNPFVFDTSGNVICLDMVARVDDSEWFKQKKHWNQLAFPHPFGSEKTSWELYIEKLDSQTGASLKFRILNPAGRIWLLTSGGGASVIIADTLADLGFASEIGNYGECSGNPDRENTRAYTATLLDAMLANHHVWKYLIIAGAIANFTHIDRTFSGIIDAFRDRIDSMREQDVHILVRRGGINDTTWLAMMKQACEELGLPCEIADGKVYMTDILTKITL